VIRLLLLLVGSGLVVAALAWKANAARQAQAGLDERLRHPEPAMRTKAIRDIGNSGLRPWAPVLLNHLDSGMDETDQAELAALVAANQWEPADDHGVVRLRRWAVDYHGANGSRTGAHRNRNRNGAKGAGAETATLVGARGVTAARATGPGPKPALVQSAERVLGTAVIRLEFAPAPR